MKFVTEIKLATSLHLAITKNIEGGLDSFIFSYMIYNQIWLNLVMDDGHFGYITKLTTQKVKYHPLEIP
jgi:hypothetical protein